MESPAYVEGLNDAQLKAVRHDPAIPLQILAGPGSGKTRVLTCRVAHLVHHHKIPAPRICAVTFTNKAAAEMRNRLRPLIGEASTATLIMGTFHAICCRYLRKHGRVIDLADNFSICDSDETKKIIAKLLKGHAEALKAKKLEMQPSFVQSSISQAKSKALSPADLDAEAEERDDIGHITAQLYEEYDATLRKNNSLDFDDLLLFGVRLFERAPHIVATCQHILVDEFQDTSILQYKLVKLFASATECVTIVGDPDQSIYGWRAAEASNLTEMKNDFPSTEQVYLEENYRSTASILTVSYAIVAEDKNRIAKGLFTSEANGSLPAIHLCYNEHAEADFMVDEIKRLIAYSGGMLNWNDFVVLLRYNALSRPIEAAFQRAGIPMRMLAGVRFFDRAEVKDILAYLQLVDNESYEPAFNRIVNVPPRSIGDKSLAEMESIATTKGWSKMTTAEKICQGTTPMGKDKRIMNKLKKDLPSFVKTIKSLRQKAASGASVPELIGLLTDLIGYELYLLKNHSDWESRWENVRELINFAAETSKINGEVVDTVAHKRQEFILEDDGSYRVATGGDGETPLRRFLQASSLSTDTQSAESDKDKKKVTISTCHAAKGLEWPIVFVPSIEDGTFPFCRSTDTDEERRLLYVACTRAQTMLYLTHTETRMSGGEKKSKELSSLIKPVIKKNPTIFTRELPTMNEENLQIMHRLLRRPVPASDVIESMAKEYRPTYKDKIYAKGDHRNVNWIDVENNTVVPARPTVPDYINGELPGFENASTARKAPKLTNTLVTAAASPPAPSNISQRPPALRDVTMASSSSRPSGTLASYFTPGASGSKPSSSNTQKPASTKARIPPPLPPAAKAPRRPSPTVAPRPICTMPKQSAATPPVPHASTVPVPYASTSTVAPPTLKPLPIASKENQPAASTPVRLATGKRRLGMGRAPDGFYAHPMKKLKES